MAVAVLRGVRLLVSGVCEGMAPGEGVACLGARHTGESDQGGREEQELPYGRFLALLLPDERRPGE